MLIAIRHPLKRVENYFTDFLLYQNSLETDENPQREELDSDNEAHVKPEAKKNVFRAEPTCNEH